MAAVAVSTLCLLTLLDLQILIRFIQLMSWYWGLLNYEYSTIHSEKMLLQLPKISLDNSLRLRCQTPKLRTWNIYKNNNILMPSSARKVGTGSIIYMRTDCWNVQRRNLAKGLSDAVESRKPLSLSYSLCLNWSSKANSLTHQSSPWCSI